MKYRTNESLVRLKIKKITVMVRGPILAGLVGCLMANTQAAVQVTRFDPPLQISAFADVPATSFFNVLAADLNTDGEVDFRLAYGLGQVGAYFNAPVRFAQRVSQPGVIGSGGPVAAVPLDSFIGTNIVSAITTNFYAWSSGYANGDDLVQPLGDHQAAVIIANVAPNNVSFGEVSNGTLVTNIIFPIFPVAIGDVVGKEGVMALEFYVNGEAHYGYIHFNFDGGTGGVIYGWAYETQPGLAIKAAPLGPVTELKIGKRHGPERNPNNTVLRTLEKTVTTGNREGSAVGDLLGLKTQMSGIAGLVDSPQGWTVGISTGGIFLTNVQTDAGGFFRVDLKPGLYLVDTYFAPHPEPGEPWPNFILEGPSKSVVVRKNHFTFVEMTTGTLPVEILQ